VPGPPRLVRADLLPISLQVAPLLLGALLVHDDGVDRVAVRLTEVEAYTGRTDPGSHAYRGLTPRTRVMFGPPGHLYVYFTYGMHWCANVVCGPQGEASAVLLRAGEVVEGVEVARSRRPAARSDPDLARGPARLATALGIGREQNGVDLCAPDARLWLQPADAAATGAADVLTGPRVGVSGPGGDAATFPWRFWSAGEPTVSVYRAGTPRRRSKVADGRLSSATGAGGDAGRDERTAAP
jgi:DNA-3-methyladenine glycosylase